MKYFEISLKLEIFLAALQYILQFGICIYIEYCTFTRSLKKLIFMFPRYIESFMLNECSKRVYHKSKTKNNCLYFYNSGMYSSRQDYGYKYLIE